MREHYKSVGYSNGDAAISEIMDWVRHATRARDTDINDYDDMRTTSPRIYSYTPANSSDLIGTEKAGDISVDTSYIYVVVDNAGTLQWQRVATATF